MSTGFVGTFIPRPTRPARGRCVQLKPLPNVKRPISRNGAVVAQLASGLSADELARKPLVFLSSQKVGDAGAAIVGKALAHPNCCITSVHMDACEVGCAGAVELAEGMKQNSTLEELIMLENMVGNAGAVALADALKSPTCKVRCLSMPSNRIGPAGGVALGKMLAVNKRLQTIYIMGQEQKGGGIGDEGAAAWAEGMAENAKNGGKFWFINVNKNAISETGMNALRAGRIAGKHHVFPVDPYPR